MGKVIFYILDTTIFFFESKFEENNFKHNSSYSIKDEKISLVNDDTFFKTARNHLQKKDEVKESPQFKVKKEESDSQPKINQNGKMYEDLFNKNEQLFKKCENYEKKNTELEELFLDKNNEVKKLNNKLEQVTEEYNKLLAKHNALLIYSSDLQKKIDIVELEFSDIKEELISYKKSDWGKLLQERDKIIRINEKELNFYKQEINNIKSNIKTDKRLDSLLDNYLHDNKKFRKIVITI